MGMTYYNSDTGRNTYSVMDEATKSKAYVDAASTDFSNANDVLDYYLKNPGMIYSEPVYQFGDYITGKAGQKVQDYYSNVNNAYIQLLQNKLDREREDSQYQRLVADLKKAGINPYYALNANGSFTGSSNQATSLAQRKEATSSKTGFAGLIAIAALILKALI